VGFIDRKTGEFKRLINAFAPNDMLHPLLRSYPPIEVDDITVIEERRKWAGAARSVGRLATVSIPKGRDGSFIVADETSEYHVDANVWAHLMSWFVDKAPLLLAVYGPQYELKRDDLIMGMSPSSKARTRLTIVAVTGAVFAQRWAIGVYDKQPARQVIGFMSSGKGFTLCHLAMPGSRVRMRQAVRLWDEKVNNRPDAIGLAGMSFKRGNICPTIRET
jgi:hypothetical protein